MRLENAFWRTWAKIKGNFRSISPESLDWVKDYDTTWLYGPLKIPDNRATVITSATPCRLQAPNFSAGQRSILKRKSALKLIFERSMSQQVLLPKAEAGFGQPLSRMCNAGLGQLDHRIEGLTYPDGGSLTTSLSREEVASKARRHVHFNDEVVQSIAIDAKYDNGDLRPELYDDEPCLNSAAVAERVPSKRLLGSCNTSHESFSGRGNTVNFLPSTTLQHYGDALKTRTEPDFNELPTISVFSKLCQWLSCSNERS